MNKQTSSQVLDELARESLGQDINLSSDLMIKVRKEKYKNMKKRTLLITLTAVVLIITILASVPSVVQAVKRLFGYLPGAGFVEQSVPLRILKQTAVTNVGETTITVSQAVTDSDQVHLFYQVENVPTPEGAVVNNQDLCHTLPKLKLADGSFLDAKTISGNFWGNGYSRQLEFDALPAQENTATLVLPCLEGGQAQEGDKAVEVALTFVQAPADMKVYPIVELPTPTAQATTLAPRSQVDQISLALKKYVQAEGQLILIGALSTDSKEFGLSVVEQPDVHLVDGKGSNIVISEEVTLQDPEAGGQNEQYLPLTYRISGNYTPGKASMIIDRVWISRRANVSFTFDPGDDPQPGQVWKIDQSLQVDGHTITIKEITKSVKGEGLSFTYETSEDVDNVSLMDLEHPELGGGGGSEITAFTYRDGFPADKITITLTGYSERLNGPWQTNVDLPALAANSTPESQPESCLTNSSWTAALNSNEHDLPAGLDGQLILKKILHPENYYHVMSTELTGSSPIDLGLGDDGSLSPDGSTLIYSTNDGLTFRDMKSGQTHLVAGSTRRDRGAMWSPDGSLIAFSRGPATGLIGAAGPYELMLMNSDGSNQRSLLPDNASNNAQTWMPDGTNLIYTTRQADGVLVQSINIENGSVSQLTQINYQNASVAVSPDGKQLAYVAMLPGERYGIYISNLDGSNPRLIANADPIVVTAPQWSPDGKWLIMSVHDVALSEDMPTLALVNPENCKIVPLTSLQGYVTSWR